MGLDCGELRVLKIFENCAPKGEVATRAPLNGKILVKAMSNNRCPGPSMLLRRASPNAPVGLNECRGVEPLARHRHAHQLSGATSARMRAIGTAAHIGRVA